MSSAPSSEEVEDKEMALIPKHIDDLDVVPDSVDSQSREDEKINGLEVFRVPIAISWTLKRYRVTSCGRDRG